MSLRFTRAVLCIASLTLAVSLSAASTTAPDGAALYRQRCASCHENSAATHAPPTSALRKLAPEGIIRSLESGSMKTEGAGLSADEKRAIAEFLTEQKTGSLAQSAPSGAAHAHYLLGANPIASGGVTGTGLLGHWLGIPESSGVRVGGMMLLDGNWLASGGVRSNSVSGNFLLGLGASIDTAKAFHIPGGQIGVEFLEFRGQNTNGEAGSVQMYNDLPTASPLGRQELHQLWWRQTLFHNKLVIKIGKINPTAEFDQVLIPVVVGEPTMQDWTISDLIEVPVGLNPTLFGRIPGYPNTAYGLTVTATPTKSFYAAYGLFDGNAGRFVQTGLKLTPDINSYKFHIGEVGYSWRLGSEGKPGRFAVGAWDQTGKLLTPNLTYENGAQGFYALASQRLWYQHPGVYPAGVTGFLQYGHTGSHASIVNTYAGGGLTGIGLIPGRPADTINGGIAWSSLNRAPYAGAFFFPNVPSTFTSLRPHELMGQFDYHFILVPWRLALDAAYSAIPTPGVRPGVPWANAFTVRLIVLF